MYYSNMSSTYSQDASLLFCYEVVSEEDYQLSLSSLSCESFIINILFIIPSWPTFNSLSA